MTEGKFWLGADVSLSKRSDWLFRRAAGAPSPGGEATGTPTTSVPTLGQRKAEAAYRHVRTGAVSAVALSSGIRRHVVS